MKNILVTGGTGFIGSHTCVCLLSEGYNVYVIDSLINSSKKSLLKIKEILRSKDIDISNKLRFFEGDIRKKDFINYIFKTALKEKNQLME